MRISIDGAKISRNLSKDWIMPDHDRPIVEVDMSLSQFAEFITSHSKGEGTPCTIRRIGSKQVAETKYINKRVQFDAEFEEAMKDLASDGDEYLDKIRKTLEKPNIGKGDREEIKKNLDFLTRKLTSTVPFIKQQFTEQMDQTVVEAKAEIEAFLDSKLASLGAAGFRKELEQIREAGVAALENKGTGIES